MITDFTPTNEEIQAAIARNASLSGMRYSVVFRGDSWAIFHDGGVPVDCEWTVHTSGLSWEAAHDAIEAAP